MWLPSITLTSTSGEPVDLSALTGTTVVYCYPVTGRPDRDLPSGWDEIPGARGCTPQSCGFRDHHAELQNLRARVFGLSTQDSAYQREAAERLHLPFGLLSDEEAGVRGGPRSPDVPGRRHNPRKAPDHDRRRRGDPEGLLSRLPARKKRRRSHRLALRAQRELERTCR
jgi:hypothetical protein